MKLFLGGTSLDQIGKIEIRRLGNYAFMCPVKVQR